MTEVTARIEAKSGRLEQSVERRADDSAETILSSRETVITAQLSWRGAGWISIDRRTETGEHRIAHIQIPAEHPAPSELDAVRVSVARDVALVWDGLELFVRSEEAAEEVAEIGLSRAARDLEAVAASVEFAEVAR